MQKSRLNSISNRNSLLKKSLLALASIFFVCLVLIAVRVNGFYNTIHSDVENQTSPKKQVEEKTEYTFLLLGYGGGTHEGTYLTDSIIVAHVNLKTKRAILISLPRDIWVKVPTTTGEDFHSKINALYQMGMFPNKYPSVDQSQVSEDNPSGILKKAVEDITGLKIDSFAAIDFEGFVKAIDTLGGIDVNVEKSFTDYEYPLEEKMNDLCERDEEFAQIEPIINKEMSAEDQAKLFAEKPELEQFYTDIKENPTIAFPCRYEELSFVAGETEMDGITALKYARSRHALADGGDFNRARRQQNVIEAAKQKILSIGFIPKIIPLLNDLENHVKTDLPLAEMNKLLLEGRNAS
ncbi:LCP family protein, partial [Candidatus Woesebacteria bacterium]|nr:LCP family protein [Candidatus Woesebacteria bacterium]